MTLLDQMQCCASPDAAIDLLFDTVDDLCLAGDHAAVVKIFDDLQPHWGTADLCFAIGLLSITMPWRSRLTVERGRVAESVRARCVLAGRDPTPLLGGLVP